MANSRRRCKQCRQYYPAPQALTTPAGTFCGIDCAIRCAEGRVAKKRIKAIKLHEKALRTQHTARKEALLTVRDHIRLTQASFNKYIRARDYGKVCISCGKLPAQKYGGTVDCGHFRSIGAASQHRLNTWNAAGQCSSCNRYLSGSAVDYRIGLIERIGVERVERLENDNTPRKFSIEYLKRFRKIFNRRARLVERRRGDIVGDTQR